MPKYTIMATKAAAAGAPARDFYFRGEANAVFRTTVQMSSNVRQCKKFPSHMDAMAMVDRIRNRLQEQGLVEPRVVELPGDEPTLFTAAQIHEAFTALAELAVWYGDEDSGRYFERAAKAKKLLRRLAPELLVEQEQKVRTLNSEEAE